MSKEIVHNMLNQAKYMYTTLRSNVASARWKADSMCHSAHYIVQDMMRLIEMHNK